MTAEADEGSALDTFARRRVVPALCMFISLATIFWSLNGPVLIGIQVYAEQLLISVLSAALAVCFLTRRASRSAPARVDIPPYDYALAGIALAFGIYLTWVFPELATNVFFRPTEAIIVSSIGLGLLLEGLRRAIGWSLLVILGVVAFYAVFADHFPGPLEGRGIAPRRVVNFMVLDSAAMAGAALYIAVAVVIPFILLARLLLVTGGSQFFSDLSAALMGRYRGGAGKIAIVGSALFGTISGSAVSNVASTGGITIPLMKASGYKAKTAAAIEASASTGGQLMPPIMGAAAFLMAENLQVPFTEVILASLVPSLLYFFSLFVFADLEAGRRGIKRVAEDLIPSLAGTMIRGWFLLMPFAVLITGLFAYSMRAETAAIYAVAVLFLISLFKTYGAGRISVRDLREALVQTGNSSVEIIIICAAAGVIIGLVSLSGLSFGLTFFLVQIGKSSLFLLLLVTAVVCIVMGMGLPTVGVYLLLATLAAPPMVQLGMEPMSAHMFVMYYGMLSMITPPVAIAAFVAANMAGAEPMRTAVEAVRVSWPAFVVPFLFAASPSLLLLDGPVANISATLTACAGVVLITATIVGHAGGPLSARARLVMLVCGILLLLPNDLFPTDMEALAWPVHALAAAFGMYVWVRSRPAQTAGPTSQPPVHGM